MQLAMQEVRQRCRLNVEDSWPFSAGACRPVREELVGLPDTDEFRGNADHE